MKSGIQTRSNRGRVIHYFEGVFTWTHHVIIMIFRVHAYNDQKKTKQKEERRGEGEKRKKKWTSAHLHSSVLICGSGATDGISNWTRETTPGVDRWHRYNGTLEETSAPCTLNPLSFVSIILPTTLAACTLVLPVIIRTSVSKGGEGEVSGGEFERRTNDKWEHVQRSRIWYREWRVSLHFSLPCCLQFISPSRP